MAKSIEYSKKYADDQFEYRHVILPKELAKKLPDPLRLLTENEWRSLGVQQSLGWVHYEVHAPEPHILLFRRPLNTDPTTGKVLSNVTAAVTNGAGAGAAPMQGVAFGGDQKMKENKPAAVAAAAKGAVKK